MRFTNATLILAVLALVALPAFAVTINEVRIDQTSTDNDEYFELAGTPGESLNGLTYIVIGDGATGSGHIEAIIPLEGYSIGADGYFLMVETTYTSTCGDTPDAVGGTLLNFENSDNVTHMLVSDFSGLINDDLDTDNDCTLDVTPWSGIIDSVSSIITPGGGDCYYSPNVVGPDGTYAPGQILVCDGTWYVGTFDLCITDTPGMSNVDACVVPDEATSFGALKSMFR